MDNCLHPWVLSQLASGALAADAQENAHLETCTTCGTALREERAEFAAAQLEPIPDVIRQYELDNARTPAVRLTPWLLRAGWAAAAACAMVFALRFTPDEPTIRTKGTPSLAIAVRRGNNVMELVPIETATLQAGDQVKFYAGEEAAAYVALQGLEDGHWVPYFEGAVPPNKWLPCTIEITARGETQLRWVRCDGPPSTSPTNAQLPAGCKAQAYHF